MRDSMRAFLLLVAVGSGATACYRSVGDGDGDADSDADSDADAGVDIPVPEGDILEAFANAVATSACTARGACCDRGWDDDELSICVSTATGELGDLLTRTIDSSRLTADMHEWQRCMDAIAANYAGCPEEEDLGIGDECESVFVGLQGDGLACNATIECADHLYCDGGSDDLEGVCRPAILEGGACADDGTPCDAPLQCLDGACRPLGRAGDACDGTEYWEGCVYGLFCDGGTCVPLREVGERCEYSDQCNSWDCWDGRCVAEDDDDWVNYCDPDSI